MMNISKSPEKKKNISLKTKKRKKIESQKTEKNTK